MSRRSRFLGGVLCLGGGCLIGFGSAGQDTISKEVGSLESSIAAVPYVTSLQAQLSSFEWFLAVGLVLFILGAILAILGGGQQQEIEHPLTQSAQSVSSPKCKFCGSPMNGSTTYCPNCGKSQS